MDFIDRLQKLNSKEDAAPGVRSVGGIIRAHTLTYFNLLNLFLGTLIFMTGSYKNMLFLGVAVCNSVIGIAQELKVRRMVLKLRVITAVRVPVEREGVRTEIPVEEVLSGDTIFVKAGAQIVADGPVLGTDFLEVNESLLTGESVPVRKEPGDMLFSGSFVTAGKGSMRAEKVGADCYASSIALRARNRRRASSELITSIMRVIRVISVAIIPVGLLLYRSQSAVAAAQAAAGGYGAEWAFRRRIVLTVSGVIGMIPEGLVLLTSVSFIIGVGHLAAKRALVQEMQAIESLARADILCTDKTGTITGGELRVEKILTIGSGTAPDYIRSVMSHICGLHDGENNTASALRRAFGERDDWAVTGAVPFSSERKYREVSFAEAGTFLLGAPEILAADSPAVLAHVRRHAERGCRCLLLAARSASGGEAGPLTHLAVIVLSDVIRADARETFAYFAKAGVQIKVLSGDSPETVAAVAEKAGIGGTEARMDARELPDDLSGMTEEIERCHIYGRVLPEQKQALVRAWQAAGHTVAMVGDGVNDVLALKDADCGIAMASGADAARHAAHIVLLNSDFASMKDIIGEGRTIICNIERVSALYLTKTIYAAVLSILCSILMHPYPWTTLQMGLINLIGIGMPSFLLTLERNEGRRKGGFIRNVLHTCVPAAGTMVLTVLAVRVCSTLLAWPHDMTALFLLALGCFVSLLIVAQVSWPLNRWRRLVLAVCVAVFAAALFLLPGFYDIHTPLTPWLILLVPYAVFVILALHGCSLLTDRAETELRARRVVRKGGA